MRDNKMDNLKGMLIILVVMGHMLELVMDQGVSKYLYELIYTFHMPLFVFVSGYFYHFQIQKLLSHLVYPYFVFQLLFTLFSRYILGKGTAIGFTQPYWIMWYLMAMILWSIGAVPFAKVRQRGRICWLLLSVAAAIAAGVFDPIGREYAFSRTIVFAPFFLWGSLASKENNRKVHKKSMVYGMAIAVMAYAVVLGFFYQKCRNVWFYEAVSYQEAGMSPWFRVLHLIMAAVLIGFFMRVMPARQLPFVSKAGRNTMQIFLLHAFVIKLFEKYEIMQWFSHPLLAAILISLVLVFALSPDLIGKVMSPLMKGKIYGKKKSVYDCT